MKRARWSPAKAAVVVVAAVADIVVVAAVADAVVIVVIAAAATAVAVTVTKNNILSKRAVRETGSPFFMHL